MDASVVTFELPAHLYAELQTLAEEEQTDPAGIIAQFVALARQRRVWLKDLAALREQIAEEGGLQVGNTKDQVVEQLRQTRREIFEAEYAHLYG